MSRMEHLECCPNYRIVGTSCEECWPGFRGVDCKEDCDPGFYGRLCGERCSCDPCDKVKGCQNISSSNTQSTTAEQDGSPMRHHWLTILIVSSGGIAICFILGLTVACIFRWNLTTRTFVLTKHDAQLDDPLPEILQYNPMQKSSRDEESRTIGKQPDYPMNSCPIIDPFFKAIANGSEDFHDVYGHIDPSDGSYNILKLKVLDENDDVYVSKSFSTHGIQNENKYMRADTNVFQATSTVSSSNDGNEPMSEKKPEKMKHQEDFFHAINSFRQKDGNERRKLRYSFVKSTEP